MAGNGTACWACLAIALLAGALALAPHPAGAERGAVGSAGRAGDGSGGFEAAPIARFENPVYVHGPKGGRGLVFVVEQAGVIRLIKNGKRLGGAFLDISDRVQAGGEQGLLSVAFSPSYAENRRFYVFFTDVRGDLVVQEYRTPRRSPRNANERTARTVIKVPHPDHSNHNGGQLQFGPDGYLYISTGDGGGGGDPDENAQSRRSLLGKILRIQPRRKQGKAYSIPPDNPFVGRAGSDEIFALGLRNPFRFSFDRRGGRIAIGDVGQGAREEVDFETLGGARGANFGWDAFEGSIPFSSSDASPPPARHELPIHEYSHAGGSCAITGGYVVRDRRVPSLLGRYVYADFCRGEIRSLVPRLDGARDDRSAGLPAQRGISSFGEDSRGRIWFANLYDGRVFVIKPA